MSPAPPCLLRLLVSCASLSPAPPCLLRLLRLSRRVRSDFTARASGRCSRSRTRAMPSRAPARPRPGAASPHRWHTPSRLRGPRPRAACQRRPHAPSWAAAAVVAWLCFSHRRGGGRGTGLRAAGAKVRQCSPRHDQPVAWRGVLPGPRLSSEMAGVRPSRVSRVSRLASRACLARYRVAACLAPRGCTGVMKTLLLL